MRVKAVIMTHNAPETTDRLYKELSEVMDVSVIDSGSAEDARPTCESLRLRNIYWTGCWNEAIGMMDDADVLWVLGGDVELRADPAEYRRAIEASLPFGCWSPAVAGRCRPLMSSFRLSNRRRVWHLEGIAMAVSKEWATEVGRLPEGNKLGWGLDIWMCWRSWRAGMRNILDGTVPIFHPEVRGYSSEQAFVDMERWFLSEMGPGWRDELRYWSDDFEQNLFLPSVSVIVASYNQRDRLELCLESLARQTVRPFEVIVSDDGSTDGTVEWLDSLPPGRWPFETRYVAREHDGYNLVAVNNLAAARTKGNRVLFTNADCLHSPKSVEAHAGAGKAIAGGLLTGISRPASDGVKMDDVVDFRRVEELSGNHPPEMTNADWLAQDPNLNFYGIWGGNYSVPAELLSKIGGFSAEYHLKYGGEEADFIKRAAGAGAKVVWVKGSAAYHLEHEPRIYRKKALGNVKYREEHLGA